MNLPLSRLGCGLPTPEAFGVSRNSHGLHYTLLRKGPAYSSQFEPVQRGRAEAELLQWDNQYLQQDSLRLARHF
jgi:hypothetical protein